MRENQEFYFSLVTSPEQAADYLEALARGLRQGQVTLSTGDERFKLAPSRETELDLRASRRGVHNRVSLELTWRDHSPSTKALSIDSEKD